MQSIFNILHKNFQEDQLNSGRFPGGFLNSSRFPGVADTLIVQNWGCKAKNWGTGGALHPLLQCITATD